MAAITDKTVLISIMHANNEIGVLQPVREIGRIAKERGVLFHTDGTQAAGKIPVNVLEDNLVMMSVSAHKMYGPKGVGALYVRRRNPRVQLTAQMDGGGHERSHFERRNPEGGKCQRKFRKRTHRRVCSQRRSGP